MTRIQASATPSQPPARLAQRVRASAATLAGAVLGWFHLLPLASGFMDHASRPASLVWVIPLVGAVATGVWAWHSAFGCRLVGVCTLLTAPVVLFGLLLMPPELGQSPLAVTILLPSGVAAIGILTFMVGSGSFARLRSSGRHQGREARATRIRPG